MEDQKKVLRNLEPTDTYDENPPIIQRFRATYSKFDDGQPKLEDCEFKKKPDPVKQHDWATRHPKEEEPDPMWAERKEVARNASIDPSIGTRIHLDAYPHGIVGAKYDQPQKHTFKWHQHEKRLEFYNVTKFCDYEVIRLPSPIVVDDIEKITEESPNVSKAKVLPERPSAFTSSMMVPPTESFLKANKIRSGIKVNVREEDEGEEEESSDTSESSSLILPKKRPKKIVKVKRRKGVPPPSGKHTMKNKHFDKAPGDHRSDSDEEDRPGTRSRSTYVSDNLILGKFGEILSNASLATSMQDNDLTGYTDVSWCEIPLTSRLVQTLRDGMSPCDKVKKKYQRGALENHSMTRLKQKILCDFPHYTVSGMIHQCDICFPKVSQGNQGVCMPIAAYCFGTLKRPRDWISKDLDTVVELGNCLYLASIAELHLHKGRKMLRLDEVSNIITIGDKRVKFEVGPPMVKGLARSSDRSVYNISNGLRVFFLKYSAGILRTECNNFLIWRLQSCCYLFFDASPRKNNIFQDKNGNAIMSMVHTLKAIVAILLDRTNLGNCAYNIAPIKVLRVLCKGEREEDEYVKERNTYVALTDRQAVLQASYDLGDLCFKFNRNKQALAMSAIALAYSRISLPHGWHRKTLDKILIVGNQLFTLIADNELANHCEDVTVGVEHLPALFTVGPYVIEMHVYPNVYADLMYKKGQCLFSQCLKEFFEKNNNAIGQIGKSYLGIWQQRDMYFCFDPYARNKEGLKCRQGGAVVTMNKDLDALIDTVTKNFDNWESLFHLHAVKLISIHRDPQLTKIFPQHLTLHDIANETFYKHTCKKSKKRAIEKPYATVDFKDKALKSLLGGQSPVSSVYDIQSNVLSLGGDMVPPLKCPKSPQITNKLVKKHQKKKHGDKGKDGDDEDDDDDEEICDLDSPSLSDTQIEPKRPKPYDDELKIDDLAAFGLTQEEKELEEGPEGGESIPKEFSYDEDAEAEEDQNAASEFEGEGASRDGGVFSQVNSSQLAPCFTTHQINTDMTFCYKILPTLELPIRSPKDRALVIDKVAQDREFAKMHHYETVDDNMHILLGLDNAVDICEGDDTNMVIPYICIMAAAYDVEKPIQKWDKKTLTFVMRAGLNLFRQYKESFLHIDDYRFELKHTNIFGTVEIILNTYIGDGLFDTFSGRQVLEQFIDKHVFNDRNVGFVIVPHYACAIFIRDDVFYLFDPYGCNDKGFYEEVGGQGCVMRFRSLDDLTMRLIENLSRRVKENDKSGLQFRMLILAKPNFQALDATDEPTEHPRIPTAQRIHRRTVSEEFRRPSNYIKLPDGSQMVRATGNVGDLGAEMEYIAPYVCVMAAATAEKYAIRTWSTDVLDFVLRAGKALYDKSKYRFIQLTRLDIPMVSLGTTDLKIQVRHLFEAPFDAKILKYTIRKATLSEKDWAFVITENYTCAVVKRNGIYYMYDPFPCNELGLHDAQIGYSSVARFRTLDDLVNRIIFNKGKEDLAENVNYSRFAVSVCRASRLSKRMLRMLERKQRQEELAAAAKANEEDFDEAILDTEDEGAEDQSRHSIHHDVVPSKNKHGYRKVGSVFVLEGTRALQRPAQDQTKLSVDYFASLCASLMVIHKPLDIWDTKTMDRTLDLGQHVFNHADDLEHSRKRTIQNILVGKYFFDVIVKVIEIADYQNRKNFNVALKYVMRKRRFVLLWTGEGTYVIYLDPDNDQVHHVFHSYPATIKASKNKGNKGNDAKDAEKDEEVANASWIKFKNMRQMKRFLKQSNNLNRFKFYTFNVVNVTKAPRSIIVSNMIQEWVKTRKQKEEAYGKSFHEHESWLDLHNNPWARLEPFTREERNERRHVENKWYAWTIEYANDLFSLTGTISERDHRFKGQLRGKQTLANLVTVIGMTGIYDLVEWNATVVDAVLVCGYKYMNKCMEDITDENHELEMDDLHEDCECFPYTFKVRWRPIIDGTMFINSFKRYNLYRALRLFFDDYYYRAGIIIADRNDVKKMVAFAKRKENEYYMFDSSTYGSPMFAPNDGVAYMLRCTTLARLVHVLTLTLRGGDFDIYEVIADQFKAMEGDLNPYQDEKPKLKP